MRPTEPKSFRCVLRSDSSQETLLSEATAQHKVLNTVHTPCYMEANYLEPSVESLTLNFMMLAKELSYQDTQSISTRPETCFSHMLQGIQSMIPLPEW